MIIKAWFSPRLKELTISTVVRGIHQIELTLVRYPNIKHQKVPRSVPGESWVPAHIRGNVSLIGRQTVGRLIIHIAPARIEQIQNLPSIKQTSQHQDIRNSEKLSPGPQQEGLENHGTSHQKNGHKHSHGHVSHGKILDLTWFDMIQPNKSMQTWDFKEPARLLPFLRLLPGMAPILLAAGTGRLAARLAALQGRTCERHGKVESNPGFA